MSHTYVCGPPPIGIGGLDYLVGLCRYNMPMCLVAGLSSFVHVTSALYEGTCGGRQCRAFFRKRNFDYISTNKSDCVYRNKMNALSMKANIAQTQCLLPQQRQTVRRRVMGTFGGLNDMQYY